MSSGRFSAVCILEGAEERIALATVRPLQAKSYRPGRADDTCEPAETRGQVQAAPDTRNLQGMVPLSRGLAPRQDTSMRKRRAPVTAVSKTRVRGRRNRQALRLGL